MSFAVRSVVGFFWSAASLSTQRTAQSRIAAGSPDLHDLSRSLASFLYCSRFGRDVRGNASCGFGYIRISFHCAWSPPCQAERRFAWSNDWGGHGPFRGLDAPLAQVLSI